MASCLKKSSYCVEHILVKNILEKIRSCTVKNNLLKITLQNEAYLCLKRPILTYFCCEYSGPSVKKHRNE